MDWEAWRERMNQLIAEFTDGFPQHFGYPPGEPRVDAPTPRDELTVLTRNGRVAIPADLVGFYRHIGGVTMMDLDNGYAVHRASTIADALRPGSPLGVVVEVDHPAIRADVLEFGCDGGGGRFALLQTGLAGRVLFLPAGEMYGGVYSGDDGTPPVVVATSLAGLMARWERRLRTVVAEMKAS